MSLVINEIDDSSQCKIGGIYSGLYYYVLNEELAEYKGEDNSSILGNCPCIESIMYLPFLNPQIMPLNLGASRYDKARFGANKGYHPELPDNPYVFRYLSGNPLGYSVDIGEFNGLDKCPNLDYRSPRMESKLQVFPFTRFLLNDYMNTPIEIKPQYLAYAEGNKIKGKVSISAKSTYSVYVEGYMGDRVGNTECSISTCSLDLPVSSSAYSQFMATNKAQFLTGNQLSITENLVSGVGNMLSLNFGGGGKDLYSAYSTIEKANAKKTDLINTPRSVKTMGGDVMFSLLNSGYKVDLIKYQCTDEFRERIGNFFAMYGYKQNKLMSPSIKSREQFNFLKCHQANISGMTVPKDALEKIKGILEKGITFWHVDNPKCVVLDYSRDNKEVY